MHNLNRYADLHADIRPIIIMNPSVIRKTIIMTSIAMLMLIPAVAMTQTVPGQENFPDELEPASITNELELAESTLREIMSGTLTSDDDLVNVFDRTPINLMGISSMPNDPDQDGLWVGIDDEVYYEELSNVKDALTERYPNIELYTFSMSKLEWAD